MSPQALIIFPLAFLVFGIGVYKLIQPRNMLKYEPGNIPVIVGKSKTLVRNYFDVADDRPELEEEEQGDENAAPPVTIIDGYDLESNFGSDWLDNKIEPESNKEFDTNDVQGLSEACTSTETPLTPEKKLKNIVLFEQLKQSKDYQATQEINMLLEALDGTSEEEPSEAQAKQEIKKFL